MAEDRMILKEKIKLKKELGLVEGAIDATQKSKEEKINENAEVEKEMAGVEGDNIKLEEQIQSLEEQIAELDSEFKEAQLTAGKLRKMTKMGKDRLDTEEKKIKDDTKELERLNDTLDKLRRDIKREMDERKNLEYQLKTTKTRIEEMEGKFLAKVFVTRRIKKDERFFPKDKTPEQLAEEAASRAEALREAEEQAAADRARSKAKEAQDRAEKKAKGEEGAKVPSGPDAKEEDLDLSM
jgi:chromosome segregation ATPase